MKPKAMANSVRRGRRHAVCSRRELHAFSAGSIDSTTPRALPPSFLEPGACPPAPMLFCRFHQMRLINSCGDSCTMFDAEDILSRYGSKLTPKKVSTIVKAHHDSAMAYKFFDWARQQCGYKHNGLAYGALIHTLCRSRNFELVEKVLQELKAEKFSIKVPTFNFVLKCMGQEGKIQETLHLFHHMVDFGVKPPLPTYHCVLSMLVKAGFLDHALEVYQEMRDANVLPNGPTVGMLTNALCKRGKLDEALKLAECVPESVDALTLNGVVGCLCKAERPYDATAFVEKMKAFKVTPGIATYNMLVFGFCKLGKVEEALGLLEKMVDESLTPDVGTYNSLFDALCKLARIDEAWQLFERMSAKPDAITYNIMVNGLCKKRRVEDAWKLVSDMTPRGFRPTVQTYTAIFHGLFKVGKAKEACDLLHDLKESGLVLDSALHNEVINSLCKWGKVDNARVLLQQMIESGFSPDRHTYASLIDGFCKAGRSLEAVEFVNNDVLKSGCILDATAWTALFKRLCEEDRLDEAVKLYDRLVEQGFVPNKTTYNSIIKGFSKAGKLDDVKKVMVEMQKNVILPDRTTYEALIDGHIQYTSGTADLFKPLIGSNVMLNSEKYTALIDGLFKTGEVEFAMMVFHEMRRVGCMPSTHTYTALIDGLCKLNKLAEARQLFQSMKEDGCIAESATFTLLLHGFYKAGQLDEADLLYKEMQKDGIRPDAAMYNVLLDGFSQGKRSKDVLWLLDDMRVRGCPPSDPALKLLFKNLDGRDAKKVNKHIKELFGIVYTPEGSDRKKAMQVESQGTKSHGSSTTRGSIQIAKKGKALSKK